MKKICLIFIFCLSFFAFTKRSIAETTVGTSLSLRTSETISKEPFGYVPYSDITFPCRALEVTLRSIKVYMKEHSYDTFFGYITKSRNGSIFYSTSVYKDQKDTFVSCFGNYDNMKFSTWNQFGYYFEPKICLTFYYNDSSKKMQLPANMFSVKKDLSSDSTTYEPSTKLNYYFYYDGLAPTPIYTNLNFIDSSNYCVEENNNILNSSSGETAPIDLSDLYPYFLLIALCVLLVFLAIMFKRRRYL